MIYKNLNFRFIPIPRGSSHTMLGKILGLFVQRSYSLDDNSDSRPCDFRVIRSSLLPFSSGI